jgi:pyochelin synthetase
MTPVAELLQEITDRGLRITASGTDLRLQGPRERIDPALVARIKQAKTQLLAHLEPPARQTGFALTLLQRGFLIGRGDAVEIGNVASHIYHEVEGAWELDRLEAALLAVVARHGALRTSFTADGRQVEAPAVDVSITRHDLRALAVAEQQERRYELREQRTHRIFPAATAPLLAVDVALLADDRMVLYVDHDGLIMDGISMFLFFQHWWAAYQGDPEPPGSEASFAAYVAAVEAARTKAPAQRSREYWLSRLDELPPHPDLPLAASPGAIAEPRFQQHVARLAASEWMSIKERAAQAGLTQTGILLTAYAETLHRWGAGDRFTLATTLANRPPIHPRIVDAIGNFSETMLVEIERDPRATFEQRAQALQARLRRDIDHRHFSGVEVLRELGRRHGPSAGRAPYTFNSAIGYLREDVDGSALELFGPEVYTSSQTPQVWLNGFAFEQHGGVVVQFDEVIGLFPDGLVADLVAGYQTVLDLLADDSAWAATTFDLLSAAQKRRRMLANDTATPRPAELLQDAVISQAMRDPAAPAIITSAATIDYGTLYRHASAAAWWLRSQEVRRDELVALVMRRGPEQVIGMLAAIMAGAAYLPIDAGLPIERQRYMLRDGRVRCILTDPVTAESQERPRAEPVAGAARPAQDLPVTYILDAGIDAPHPARPVPRLVSANPDDLAYVLYTSGTTGEPKGVMVSHRSVDNVVADCNARFGIGPEDRFFGISAFNFDLSVYDVFGALSAGAAVVLPDYDKATDPAHWVELCEKAGVTVWNSVPAIVALLHDHVTRDEQSMPRALRLVMMSGDRVPPGLPLLLRERNPQLQVISLGGPTETTIWNISHPIGPQDDAAQSIPYGRPNANNRAYILDTEGQDMPDWVTGEICAAGVGLARGYWADEARTAERFVDDPARRERLFRTGDLGRYLPDGNIGILGRSDFQIKINGYRIEAGEVETRLIGIPEIKQAVVARQAGAQGDRLVAHLVPAGADRPGEEQIRQRLRTHLPEYMLPSAVVWHESLPLTRNGKVDRAKLAVATEETTSAHRSAGGALTEGERPIADIWATMLAMDAGSIDPEARFYELGGDSLTAARVLGALRKRFGVGITLDRFFEVDTVRAMAAFVESAGGS